MSLNDSLDQVERAKLAVWDYPVSDKFTNMWTTMQDSVFPQNFTEAKERIKNPPDGQEFAFIGQYSACPPPAVCCRDGMLQLGS